MMREDKYIAIYLRLSDEDRDQEESNSIRNQRILLRQYIQSKSEFSAFPIKEFIDDGYSGTNFERPDFQRMLKQAKEGKIKVIIVKDLSRLGRDTIETQEYVEKIFPFLGVRVIAVNDKLDTNLPAQNQNDLEIKFKNLINGIYPEMCSKNIKLQKRKTAEKGEFMGNIPIYGYALKPGESSKLLIDHEAATTVTDIFLWFTQGKRLGEIAKILNVKQIDTPATYLGKKGYKVARKGNNIWYSTTVKAILKEKAYIGTIVNHKTEVIVISTKKAKTIPPEERIECENQHEAIISKEIFTKAEILLKEQAFRKKEVSHNTEKSIFHGKICCGCCGNKMRIRMGVKSKRITCRTPSVSEHYGCMKGGIQEEELKKIILEMVNDQIQLVSNRITALGKERPNIPNGSSAEKIELLETKVQELKREKFYLYEGYVEGRVTKEEYQEKAKELSNEISFYTQSIDTATKQREKEKHREHLQKNEKLKEIRSFEKIEKLDSKIVDCMIDTIYIYAEDRIGVKWAFEDLFVAETENQV